MSTFHALHLREPSDRREKSQSQRIQNRQKQKAHLKDVLVQNILRNFGSSTLSHQAVAGNYYLSNFIGQEVEKFLNSEQLTQKNLRELEKQILEKIKQDPNLKDISNEINNSYQEVRKLRNHTQGRMESQTFNNQRDDNLKLPSINNSHTPNRVKPTQLAAYNKKQINKMRQSQAYQQQNRSSLSYGPGHKQNILSTSKPHQQSLQVLNQDSFQNNNSLLKNKLDYSQAVKKDLMTERQRNEQDASKSFADLRVRLGKQRRQSDRDEAESIPSGLTEDEWAEIVRYQKEQYEEEKAREKIEQERKKEMVRKTLESQLQEKRNQKQQEISARQSYDRSLLQNIKEKEEKEKEKEKEFKQKIYEQKRLRDMQLEEAKVKKEKEFIKQREQELVFMNKLKQEINEERQSIIEKKRKEREVCQKIIQENEAYKVQQQIQKDLERQRDQKEREDYDKFVEAQEKKRQEEWNQREQRIQSLMNKMANTVVKKSNEQERENERKLLKYQMEKEQNDAKKDELKKQKLRRKHEDIQQSLQLQIKEKQQQKEQEQIANEIYIKRQITKEEREKKEKEEEEQHKKQQRLELQEFLKKQMDEGKINDNVSIVSKKKQTQIGTMNIEEYRLNKQLLKEISQKKKERGRTNDKSAGNSMIQFSGEKDLSNAI